MEDAREFEHMHNRCTLGIQPHRFDCSFGAGVLLYVLPKPRKEEDRSGLEPPHLQVIPAQDKDNLLLYSHIFLHDLQVDRVQAHTPPVVAHTLYLTQHRSHEGGRDQSQAHV